MNPTRILQQYILIKPNNNFQADVNSFQNLRSLENAPTLLQNVTHMHVQDQNIPTANKKDSDGFGKIQKPSSMTRRNARERRRVKMINMGYETLRTHIPTGSENRKLSKVDTLRAAVDYIKNLQLLLDATDPAKTPTSDISLEELGLTQSTTSPTSSHALSPIGSPTYTEDISEDEHIQPSTNMQFSPTGPSMPLTSTPCTTNTQFSNILMNRVDTSLVTTNASQPNSLESYHTNTNNICIGTTTSLTTATPCGAGTITNINLMSPPAIGSVASSPVFQPTTPSYSAQSGTGQTFLLNHGAKSLIKEENVFMDIAEWLCKSSTKSGAIKLEGM